MAGDINMQCSILTNLRVILFEKPSCPPPAHGEARVIAVVELGGSGQRLAYVDFG